MRRSIKRSTLSYITVSFLSLLVVGLVFITAYIVTTKGIKRDYDAELATARDEISTNKRNVYLAIGDIAAGQPITNTMVERKETFASQDQNLYMDQSDIGKIALITIGTGTQILDSMLTEEIVSSEVREAEYDTILINTNVIENDYVDVRIMFPNGEDYIVLSKKVIKGMTLDSGNCFLWLTEEELLRMASATVDAFLYSGAKIYTTKYIEPNLQEASLITYEPSVSTILLIQDNPNIVATATTELSKQIRKAMENRLAASYSTSVEDIDWVLSQNEIAKADEVPEVLKPDAKATFQDEQKAKDEVVDYGP